MGMSLPFPFDARYSTRRYFEGHRQLSASTITNSNNSAIG
jgi:hypothetical protein